MSRFTHAICGACWMARRPGQEPVRISEEGRRAETCCFCGRITSAGIDVRHDPTALRCEGRHDEDAS